MYKFVAPEEAMLIRERYVGPQFSATEREEIEAAARVLGYQSAHHAEMVGKLQLFNRANDLKKVRRLVMTTAIKEWLLGQDRAKPPLGMQGALHDAVRKAESGRRPRPPRKPQALRVPRPRRRRRHPETPAVITDGELDEAEWGEVTRQDLRAAVEAATREPEYVDDDSHVLWKGWILYCILIIAVMVAAYFGVFS